jgi:dolichyl-phosphate beta-glucosyltransferase
MRPELSLVVPVFNEEGRLPSTLQRLSDFSRESALSLEVIVADDGSSDRTCDAFRDWTAGHHPEGLTFRLVSIRHRGKGAAVRAGMAHASAPLVGYCDADLSAGPDAIVQLLDAVRAGADFAMASRGLRESVLAIRQPWYRELAGRSLNLGLRLLTRLPFKDTQCGLKICRAEVARDVFGRQRLDGFAFDIELILLAMQLNYRVVEIPIRWAHATGSKVSLVRDALRMGRDTFRVVRRVRRGAIQPPGVPDAVAMRLMTGAEDEHWWHVAKRRLVIAQLQTSQPPRRCLDIGCGGGAMLVDAAPFGPVVGTDLSVHALAHARSRGLRALVRSEAAAVPLAGGTFATVLALDVSEHQAQPERLLAEIARVLVPGGRLIVTVPAFQWMWSYADDVLGHYRRYNRQQLIDELTAAGFTVRRASYFHSWLLPVAWVVRVGRDLVGRSASADDSALPGVFNRALLAICAFERRLIRKRSLPFGLSVLAIAEKP